MSMNSEQTKGLAQVRNKFVSDRKAIADFEFGTVHTKLDVLTIEDLRYLANFPNVVRHSIVDLELTDDQIIEESSPVFDLAAASKKAVRAAEALEEHFWKYLKAFDDEMKSGFRLEGIWEEPKYKTIAKSIGLDIKTVTLRFLADLDVKEAAKKIKDEIVNHFGFEELAKMYTPGGKALKIDRLMEKTEERPDGPNPVLFEAIAAEIVDDFSLKSWGKQGFVKQGNVILKLAPPDDTGSLKLPPGNMAVVEIGVNVKRFSLTAETEESFPNMPSVKFSPVNFKGPVFVETVRREMENRTQKGLKFLVEADISRSIAVYSANFGHVDKKA